MLRARAFPDITIADIAAEAGVSPATIYQRFANTDAAIAILLELYYRRVEDWAHRPRQEGHSSPSSLYEALLEVGRTAWDQIEALGYIMRPAYLYSRLRPELAGPEWNRLQEVAAKGFQAFLTNHANAIKVDDPEKAAASLCLFYNFMIAGKLLHAGENAPAFLGTRDAFAGELADFAYGYLNVTNRGA